MKRLYRLIFTLALPAILVRLIWRGLRAPAYWRRWSERFAWGYRQDVPSDLIWVHAVSVGEVEAARPLIHALMTQPNPPALLITTMTPTGSARVRAIWGTSVLHVYLPYDMQAWMRRFLQFFRPRYGILMETELWPNLIDQAAKLQIPLVVANARLSARSARGYARFAALSHAMLQQLAVIATQTADDRERFIALGAPRERVHAVGNLKFELQLPASLIEQAESMRAMWGNRRVWIAGSTHEGEESLVLQAARQVRGRYPDALLVIVPRHPERFDRVASLARRMGHHTLRRSEHKPCHQGVEVLVVDTMGELLLFYACADVALVGGSLIPHGGHNLLEPAALGRPVLMGPYCFNFQDISQQFLRLGAALRVAPKPAGIAEAVCDLLGDPTKRSQMGDIGAEVIRKNQGATQRLLNLLGRHLP